VFGERRLLWFGNCRASSPCLQNQNGLSTSPTPPSCLASPHEAGMPPSLVGKKITMPDSVLRKIPEESASSRPPCPQLCFLKEGEGFRAPDPPINSMPMKPFPSSWAFPCLNNPSTVGFVVRSTDGSVSACPFTHLWVGRSETHLAFT
jgi:hypothetical protein